MFINSQKRSAIEYYQKMLQIVGSISNLFSESQEPFLHYRVAENLFCKSFNAENRSRADISADATLDHVGFGLKTFGRKGGAPMEKVAEFNTHSATLRDLNPMEQVSLVAKLRNERIEATQKIYDLNSMLYHCIVRSEKAMHVIECPMHTIDIPSIEIGPSGTASVFFKDKNDEYSFNFSKSTLFKRFHVTDNILLEFPVDIMKDPFEVLAQLMKSSDGASIDETLFSSEKKFPHIFLPLYSFKKTIGRYVPERSGLNQWAAGGRDRKPEEVYIRIPSWIHKKFPEFLPQRDQYFNLHLPNSKIVTASVCQDNSKALMSNPNKALGQWILRDVLKLKDNQIVNYDMLKDIGLDSVIIYKIDDHNFEMDFCKIDSFDNFEKKFNIILNDDIE